LYIACYHGQQEVVRELLRIPAVDIDRLSEESASVLAVCLAKGHLEVARAVRWRALWPCIRLLWLARRKNKTSRCPLANLPDVFIARIVRLLVTAEVARLAGRR